MSLNNRRSSIQHLLALLASVSVISLALTACGDEEVRVEDYDRSCQTASDCVAIETGDGDCCTIANCNANAAINRKDFAQWKQDFGDASDAKCSDQVFECPNIACLPKHLECRSGICQLDKAEEVGDVSFER